MADRRAAVPRPDYPRPQFRRAGWASLNGTWRCAIDPPGAPPVDRRDGEGLDRTILVPFCPESRLSGIGHTDFIESLWYAREIEIPADWADRVIRLHFGGVDWSCTVFVDGRPVGEHHGGSAAFHMDVTRFVRPGDRHRLVVHVRDATASGLLPCGKQSRRRESHGCYYTRVTGIWQSVWLEPLDPAALEDAALIPDLAGGALTIVPTYRALLAGGRLAIEIAAGGETVARAEVATRDGVPVPVPVPAPRAWAPEDPFLYDVTLTVRDAAGRQRDRVTMRAGLRDLAIEDGRLMLNGRPLRPRFVLDQGYFPDGLWTAPDVASLERDIALGRSFGFNGARLHQKVFEPAYLDHADRTGYLTWVEAPSWGFDENEPVAARNFLSEWARIVRQCRNHPSVIAWTPLNETETRTVGPEHRRLVRDAYDLTRALDPTRPVNDASGWVHQRTDLWTVHCYDQDPEALRRQLTPPPDVFRNHPDAEPPWEGQPYLVDEFGGIQWNADAGAPGDAWGYGDAPTSEAAFLERLEGLVAAVDEAPGVQGWCYTQLTDVEQEVNGLCTADRRPKFDPARLRAVFEQGA